MQTPHPGLTPESTPQLETLIAEQRSLLQSVNQEVQLLTQRLATLSAEVRQQSTLGFSNGRDYIIIERDKNILWHRFENDEPVPIKSKILKGYIRRVVFVDKEYPKLHIFIEGDREYVLVTGFETYFARELLAAIGTLKPADLAYPVIIKPDIGSAEGKSKHQPIFCNVIYQGRTIKPGALRNQDISQLYKRAEAILTQSHESNRCSPNNVSPFPSQRPQSSTAGPELLNIPSPSAQATAAKETQAVNWGKVCHDLKISKQQLMAIARRLNLPHGKLTRTQSAQLYQAVYQQYGEAAG